MVNITVASQLWTACPIAPYVSRQGSMRTSEYCEPIGCGSVSKQRTQHRQQSNDLRTSASHSVLGTMQGLAKRIRAPFTAHSGSCKTAVRVASRVRLFSMHIFVDLSSTCRLARLLSSDAHLQKASFTGKCLIYLQLSSITRALGNNTGFALDTPTGTSSSAWSSHWQQLPGRCSSTPANHSSCRCRHTGSPSAQAAAGILQCRAVANCRVLWAAGGGPGAYSCQATGV